MKTDEEIEKIIYSDTYFIFIKRIEDLIASGFKPSHDLIAYAGKLGKMAELPPEVLRGLELLRGAIPKSGGVR